ncbi:MAG TPA: NADH-quinone oxidoreductase subunit N [Chthoniobacteraceae bacterium]|nr:NADH-quinone oxidoreductase subunit N [Chthoniobacteraceae bacterium]
MPPLFSPITLEVIVLSLGFFLLFAEAFSKGEKKSWMAHLAIYVLGIVFCWTFFTKGNAGVDLERAFYSADATALFFKRIAIVTTMVVLVMALEFKDVLAKYLPQGHPGAGVGEFYALPVLTCAGLMFMASAVDFLLIFVSLELVTISFYVLVAYMRRNLGSLEAGVKYLILGALSTGFLVYGITWIFGLTGETNLFRITRILPNLLAEGGRLYGSQSALLFGLMLVLVGLGFKVAAAPFQLWVPDVYQGAPTPVTAFLSVGSKAAGFVVLIRVLEPFLAVPGIREKVIAVLVILAAATLIYGSLAAMPQDNFKRLLAYSSIANAGYLLVAVASSGNSNGSVGSSQVAVAFYIAGYLIMTLLSFLVLIVVTNHSRGDDILHFNGLGRRSPFLAFGLLAASLSLAGIPFTVGFYGKLLVFAAAVKQQQYVLIGVGIVTVAAGFYYYLRVVAAMYWQEPNDDTPIRTGLLTKLTVGTLTALIFIVGIFPQPILNMMREFPAKHPAFETHVAKAPGQ